MGMLFKLSDSFDMPLQKEKVKEIGAPRHKLVVQVTIGEVQGQGVRIASRCLWDVETDNHASAYYTNPHCERPVLHQPAL